MSAIAAGDVVVLVEDSGDRYLLTVAARPDAQRVRGIGVIDSAKLAGAAWGSRLTHGAKTFLLLKPGYLDLALSVERKAQIILPKDAARILYECDVRAGKRVLEAGIGSAALTSALARAVTPGGKVTTYEIREDFAEWGRGNLARAGLSEAVEVKVGDVRRGVAERGLDAAILDMPDPWEAVGSVAQALAPGGFFCAYSPLVSQVEQTHAALAKAPFAQLRTIELIERDWTVGERGARPSFEMLGHTGFLTFARRVA